MVEEEMGKRKEVIYYNNRFKGKFLTDDDCDRLEKLKVLAESDGVIEDLLDSIYVLSDEQVEQVLETKTSEFIDKEKGELRPDQTTALGYLLVSKRCLLADSVGLGKTVIVAGLINILKDLYKKKGHEFRYLYLTEKNLVKETQTGKLVKFTGEYVKSVFGEKQNVEKFIEEWNNGEHCSIIGPYSLINSVLFQEFFREYDSIDESPFDMLIMDEPSILNNSATKTFKNALYFRDFFDRIILLDATPLDKELMSKYNKLNFMDETLLPTKTNFSKEYEIFDYTGPYPVRCNKYKNEEDFKYKIAYRALGRTRKSLMKAQGVDVETEGMVNCSANLVVSKLSIEQRELLKKTSIKYMVYDCPWYLDSSIEMNTITTPKLQSLVDLLDGELKDVEQIIIYSRYKEAQWGIYNVLDELGYSAKIMNGDTELEEKNNLITGFKNGEYNCLITNVMKGLDFGNCDVCVFYSYDPNPSKMIQFEGRITRSFKIENKHIYVLVSKGEELRKLKTTIKDRAKAIKNFEEDEFSCVMDLLLKSKELNNGK